MMENSLQYNTELFVDVWKTAAEFKADFQDSPFAGCIHYGEAKPSPETGNYPDNVTLLYYLLYAKFGSNPIANITYDQWKFKVYSIIFQYGPTWEKRLEIQGKLRDLTEADIMQGAKAIYNSALNPSSAPSTGSLEELEYINGQNTTNYKRSKMEAYSVLWEALKSDVSEAFLSKFKVCFKKFVMPERVLVYANREDDDNE